MKQVASKSIWKSCNILTVKWKSMFQLVWILSESAQNQYRYKKLHTKLNFKGTLYNKLFLPNKTYLYTVHSLLYSVMEHS